MARLITTLLLLLNSALICLPQEWTLVWADEFNYTGLPDPNKWVYDVGGSGWGNNELQYYTQNRLENARVEDGRLIIEAIKEDYQGRNYTSARLLTREKGDWLYGRVEVRAKLPGGRGIWPAIWMLPTDWEYGNWPASGEIDIMEYVGFEPNRVHFTVHTEAYNHSIGTQRGASSIFDDPENNFYTYVIEWYPERIDFLVDDVKYFTFARNENDTYAQWPFDKRFHLLLNIAVGGDWGGSQGIDDNIFPQTMEVEYVRVYKSAETIVINSPNTVHANHSNAVFSIIDIDGWEYHWVLPDGVEATSGINSSSVTVNWGCAPDTIKCIVTTDSFEVVVSQFVSITPPAFEGTLFFENNQQGLQYSVTELHSTTYSWSIPSDATIAQGAGTNAISVNWGATSDSVKVNISNSCYTTTLGMLVVPKGQYPYPDIFTPHTIPGTINATHYDYGGQGVAYHDNSATNEGSGSRQDEWVDTEYGDNGKPNVGWITSGEWLEFTIRVEKSGWYRIAARMASNSTAATRGPLRIVVNGDLRAELEPPQTGAWNNFRTITEDIDLYSTDTLLRVEMGVGNFNLGDMTFTVVASSADYEVRDDIKVFPNPINDFITVSASKPINSISIYSLTGQLVMLKKYNGGEQERTINLPDIPHGAYIVTILLEGGKRVSRRMIKVM